MKTKEIDQHLQTTDNRIGELEDSVIEYRTINRYRALLWGTIGGALTAVFATVAAELIVKLIVR